MCIFAPSADDPDTFMDICLDPLAARLRCWHPYRQPCNLQSWIHRLHNFIEQPLVVAVCADLAENFLVPGHENEDRIKNTAIGIGRGSGEEFELVVQPGQKLLQQRLLIIADRLVDVRVVVVNCLPGQPRRLCHLPCRNPPTMPLQKLQNCTLHRTFAAFIPAVVRIFIVVLFDAHHTHNNTAARK